LSQLPASFVTFLGDLRAEPVITASAAGRKADIILIHCRDDCPGAQALAGGIKIDDGFLVGSFFQQRKILAEFVYIHCHSCNRQMDRLIINQLSFLTKSR